ncbi:MAG: ribosome small subunit-dependent GTPase A, partial [Maribacter sp.]|nr:ribosome small subunit-dependent GTPase A [Maribacter sp.]
MTIKALGFNENLEQYIKKQNLGTFEFGRIILEHKERYVIKTAENEFDAELIGNLRFKAESRYDF